ncbi:hypothetical protein Hanom_Chr12g01153501 [Helianthus anomalus]
MCHLLLNSIVSLYLHLCVTHFVSRGSTCLTGSPLPWVELGITIIVSRIHLSGLESLYVYSY